MLLDSPPHGRQLAESSFDVGLLWVCWGGNAGRSIGTKANPRRYLTNILKGSRKARESNPKLPQVLATDYHDVPPSPRLRLIVNVTLSPRDSGWIHRLRAFALSPFKLTLAVDDSVIVCANLEPWLHEELARDRLDIAINFESVPLPSLGGRLANVQLAPRRVEDMTPHCFALLLRRGAGLRALLSRWEYAMRYVDSFDQWALRYVFRSLSHTRWLDSGNPGSWQSTGRKVLGKLQLAQPPTPVRLMRLTGAIAAFKSLDKRTGFFWPRYLHPVAGSILLIHSYQKEALLHEPAHNSICSALNKKAPAYRLVVQPERRLGYMSHTSKSACIRAMQNASVRARVADVCGLLLDESQIQRQRTNVHITPPVETLSTFWSWVQAVGMAHPGRRPYRPAALPNPWSARTLGRSRRH